LNTGVQPMKKTTKISGASVNLTTAPVHRLIKPMHKTTQGLRINFDQPTNVAFYLTTLLVLCVCVCVRACHVLRGVFI
jgi:hypothetical protein